MSSQCHGRLWTVISLISLINYEHSSAHPFYHYKHTTTNISTLSKKCNPMIISSSLYSKVGALKVKCFIYWTPLQAHKTSSYLLLDRNVSFSLSLSVHCHLLSFLRNRSMVIRVYSKSDLEEPLLYTDVTWISVSLARQNLSFPYDSLRKKGKLSHLLEPSPQYLCHSSSLCCTNAESISERVAWGKFRKRDKVKGRFFSKGALWRGLSRFCFGGGWFYIGLRGFWTNDHTDSNGPMHLLDHHQFSTSVFPGLNFFSKRLWMSWIISYLHLCALDHSCFQPKSNGEMACLKGVFGSTKAALA